jgi:hypothetical protein
MLTDGLPVEAVAGNAAVKAWPIPAPAPAFPSVFQLWTATTQAELLALFGEAIDNRGNDAH